MVVCLRGPARGAENVILLSRQPLSFIACCQVAHCIKKHLFHISQPDGSTGRYCVSLVICQYYFQAALKSVFVVKAEEIGDLYLTNLSSAARWTPDFRYSSSSQQWYRRDRKMVIESHLLQSANTSKATCHVSNVVWSTDVLQRTPINRLHQLSEPQS